MSKDIKSYPNSIIEMDKIVQNAVTFKNRKGKLSIKIVKTVILVYFLLDAMRQPYREKEKMR
ncbi:MAG: hypothetical protein FWC09_07730 [Lachnospiraceae bacterium]|nr:hypothetical protein [Lachnospiraceae bacterium]